jgi:hypothetical protein
MAVVHPSINRVINGVLTFDQAGRQLMMLSMAFTVRGLRHWVAARAATRPGRVARPAFDL